MIVIGEYYDPVTMKKPQLEFFIIRDRNIHRLDKNLEIDKHLQISYGKVSNFRVIKDGKLSQINLYEVFKELKNLI